MNNWTWHFIVVCWIVFLIYWFITAFNVKQTIEHHGNFRSRFFAAIIIAWLILILLPKRLSQLSLWHTSLYLGIFTDFIVLVGLGFAIWARITLGRNWSGNITFKKDHELIESGPYSLVRHPIYTGILLMAVGGAINYGQPSALILLLVLLLGFWVKYQEEEKVMIQHFPKQYKAYKKRVKAIIPFVV